MPPLKRLDDVLAQVEESYAVREVDTSSARGDKIAHFSGLLTDDGPRERLERMKYFADGITSTLADLSTDRSAGSGAQFRLTYMRLPYTDITSRVLVKCT